MKTLIVIALLAVFATSAQAWEYGSSTYDDFRSVQTPNYGIPYGGEQMWNSYVNEINRMKNFLSS